ncbi:MAG: carboxypeptidase-like regulatory domain-containing protein [Polyangiales bacterium]
MRRTVPLILGLFVWLLSWSTAEAQVEPAREGLSGAALCGLVSTAFPTCPKRIALAATGAYGYTESMGAVSGAHHRMSGALALGIVPLDWLALAVRFDGRIDIHPDDALGSDRTGVGDPRLILRMGHAFERLSLGGEAVLWFPGTEAPSVEPRATTVDLRALLAYKLSRAALLLAVGARVDQSSKSAPDRTRLRPGDRIAIGLSDFHAVLVALGASGRVGDTELFGEAGIDLLVGDGAPPVAESPLRVALGARQFFTPRVQAELSIHASLSKRPGVSATDPLVPIEPRFGLSAGVRYGFVKAPPPPPEAPPEPRETRPPEPTTAEVAGVLHDPSGAPLPDVRVVLRVGSTTRETVTDGDGRYAFADVPVGAATLETSAPGFAPERWQVQVRPRMEPAPARALTAKADVGTLRVLTRTFTSEPLSANVLVNEPSGRKAGEGRSDAAGRFELELRPGRYVVTISAPGYRPHRRDVQIERYGVAIMNVDMRGLR